MAQHDVVVVPAIRAALDEILDAERAHCESQLLEWTHGLQLAVAGLESALSALEVALATERGTTLDRPSARRVQ